MSGFRKMNILDAEDRAPGFGMSEMGEARFLRDAVGAESIGLAYYRMNPGQRPGFGHRHEHDEEMYVVVSGSGRIKVEEEVVELSVKDVVFCAPGVMREIQAGDDGIEVLAFGAHTEGDGEMQPGWWDA